MTYFYLSYFSDNAIFNKALSKCKKTEIIENLKKLKNLGDGNVLRILWDMKI